MVYIISGPIHSGKSSTLLAIYNEASSALITSGGFASEKTMNGTNRFTYALKNLVSGEEMPLALDQSDFNGEFKDIYAFDRFYFNQQAFDYGNALLIALSCDPNVHTIFIDEIGIIELEGNGFSTGFKAALASEKNIYVCVRDKWLSRVVEYFRIGEGDKGTEILSPQTLE